MYKELSSPMDKFYKFVIDQRPVAKSNMYGVRVIGKRGIIYTTKALEDYELKVGQLAREVIPNVLTGFQSIYIRVYQKGKKWIDIDNCFKAIQDGLDNTKTIKRGKKEIKVCETGIANDKYFQLVIGERIIVETEEEQRVEVLIAPYEGLLKFVGTIAEEYKLDEDYYEYYKDMISFD
jgi:Holliday junction resolvase RusA-like endonuclease